MIRKIPDDSDRNYDIVHMIKKIAIGLESKNVDDLQAIAHELEGWVPHGNWGKLDVKTKVFVEHILMALGRLQLGFELLDKGAGELTDIRQKMEKDEIHDLMDEADHEDDFERKMGELASEYHEIVDEAQKITTENIDRFTRRNLDRVDRREKFTCEKCGIEKRSSAPGVNNRKEVDGHVICGRCYRAFKNWFEKTNRKLDEFWDENVRKGTWDGGPIDPSVKEGIRRLMRDYSLPNGQIDWDKFHRARKKMKDHKKDRQNKLTKKKCRWGFDGCDCMQECCNKCERLVDNDSAKIFKDYGICRKCYEDEPNIDEIYKDETIQPKGWDEREKRLSDVHKKIDELKKNFGFSNKKGIDWDRYHKQRRGRFKKDEISDDEKEDLK